MTEYDPLRDCPDEQRCARSHTCAIGSQWGQTPKHSDPITPSFHARLCLPSVPAGRSLIASRTEDEMYGTVRESQPMPRF
eukprot:COSAG01_NODE_2109_length_8408_cov_33.352870_10_plen_80_part_00